MDYCPSLHLISTSFKLRKTGTKVCAGLLLRVAHQDRGGMPPNIVALEHVRLGE